MRRDAPEEVALLDSPVQALPRRGPFALCLYPSLPAPSVFWLSASDSWSKEFINLEGRFTERSRARKGLEEGPGQWENSMRSRG